MIRIAVVNQSTIISEAEVSAMVAAWQTQVVRDLYPAWGAWAGLYHLSPATPPDADMWVLGLFNNSDQANALGYHDVTPKGQPLGKVFVNDTIAAGDAVSVTGSHELLEMLGDPDVNLVVQDGTLPRRFWANELCDAVEDDRESYQIASVRVSNFVLPAYFQPAVSTGGPYDFGGALTGPVPALTPGGYMAYVQNGVWSQVFGSARARQGPGRPGGSHRFERRRQYTMRKLSRFPVAT